MTDQHRLDPDREIASLPDESVRFQAIELIDPNEWHRKSLPRSSTNMSIEISPISLL